MRVWERGTGETLACGTGACSSIVAGVLNDMVDRNAKGRAIRRRTSNRMEEKKITMYI